MKQLYLYIRLASVLLLLSACAQDNMRAWTKKAQQVLLMTFSLSIQ